jgi:hypothetical protein
MVYSLCPFIVSVQSQTQNACIELYWEDVCLVELGIYSEHMFVKEKMLFATFDMSLKPHFMIG